MKHNLIISYDLYKQGQNYDGLINEIKKLGSWAKVHMSLWYVQSPYTCTEAVQRLKAVIDRNDKLFAVDATLNQAAWHNLSEEVSRHIRDHWNIK